VQAAGFFSANDENFDRIAHRPNCMADSINDGRPCVQLSPAVGIRVLAIHRRGTEASTLPDGFSRPNRALRGHRSTIFGFFTV